MNRKTFFKALVGTTTALVVAPKVLAKYEEPEYISTTRYFIGSDPATGHCQSGVVIDVSKIPDGFTLEDIVKVWREYGIMLIDSTKIR